MIKKRLLAISLVLAMLLTAGLTGVLPAVAEEQKAPEGFTTDPGFEAALQSGQSIKVLADYAGEDGGVHTLIYESNWPTLDVDVATENRSLSAAKYLQFEIHNNNALPLQLFFGLLQGPGGYQLKQQDGSKALFYDLISKSWAVLTTKKVAAHGQPGFEIPANTKGILRIPLDCLALTGGNVANDEYTLNGNLEKIQFYTQLADGDGVGSGTVSFDNVALISGIDPSGFKAEADFEAALQSGQSVKLLTDYAGEAGGVHTLTYAENWPTLDVDVAAENRNLSTAKYLQFEINNDNPLPLQLFFGLLQGPGGYQLKQQDGAKALFYDLTSKSWTVLTTKKVAVHGVPGFEIPAETKGILRIPMNCLSLTGGNVGNDEYTLNGNLEKIQFYTQLADGDGVGSGTVIYDNVAFIGGAVEASTPGGEGGVGEEDGGEEGDTGEGEGFGPTENEVALQEGQTYKEINGFENATGVVWGVVPDRNITGDFAETGMANGGKSYRFTFSSGDENAIIYPTVSPDNDIGGNWKGAREWQFYVENTGSTKLQINAVKYFTKANGGCNLKKSATVLFYNLNDQKWYNLKVADGYNTAYYGVEIPAGAKGFVRIALNAANFDKFEVESLAEVTGIELFLQMPGCPADSVIYLDDFGLIGGKKTEIPAGDAYTADLPVKLNPGEKGKELTGFEDGDAVTLGGQYAGVNLSDIGFNNGSSALKIEFEDGSAGGFRNFTLNTSSVGFSDWSDAKYLQFYVQNTAAGGAPLQLFYVQMNGNKMLSHGATGLKLYDLSTSKWSDLTVVDNSDHVLGGTETKVPTIQIPAGFRGYVRIPLTTANFANLAAADLASISSLEMYALIRDVDASQGAVPVYFDDFSLITYDGDTAPDYVDGSSSGGDDDGNDDPFEGVETIFTLTGELKDASGNKLAGAKVTLNGTETTTADKNGRYIFRNVKTGLYELTVVGADGTDYGFITIEVKTAAETSNDGTVIKIAQDADGLIVNFGVDDLGLILDSVTEGILEVGGSAPATGSAAIPAAVLALAVLSSLALTASRKRFGCR